MSARRRVHALAVLLGVAAGLWARSARAEDQPAEMGPEIVILRELENAYEPVPFNHLTHARMAEMWNGCVTCHHYSPKPGSRPPNGETPKPGGTPTQEGSAEFPACKSCHPVTIAENGIHLPNLKGAYHRQCLNCHKDWMHENACVICHAPKLNAQPAAGDPSPGDIVGRMHPPIPEPVEVAYRTRFTPADGGNVLFRHKQHTSDFGTKCVQCHRRDNCADCHSRTNETIAVKPVRPGMTWEESHTPCMTCHGGSRCRACHYKDDQPPPQAFRHDATGQGLDEAHAALACAQCHIGYGPGGTLTCGDASCHKEEAILYPDRLPGPLVPPEPEVVEPAGPSPGSDPS